MHLFKKHAVRDYAAASAAIPVIDYGPYFAGEPGAPLTPETVAFACELCQTQPECESVVLAVLYGYLVDGSVGSAPVSGPAPGPYARALPWFYGVDVPAGSVMESYVASVLAVVHRLNTALLDVKDRLGESGSASTSSPTLIRPSQVVLQAAVARCVITAQLATRASAAMTLATVFLIG